MVVGDVVNTASRLQSAAPVNGVLVGRETYAATRSTIAYAAAPPVVAKGKVAPVEVWLALDAAAPAGERRLSEAPLVGRERDLELLARLWEQVRDDRRPHLLTVIGPGRDRQEPARGGVRAPRRGPQGGRALRGRSLPYGDSSAYGAFAQHVKQVAGIFDNDDADVALEKLGRARSTDAELTRGARAAARLPGRQARSTAKASSSRRASSSSSVARDQPTMLVFEDIHWADSSLLDLIEVLSARTQDVPLLLVALARPELFAERPALGRRARSRATALLARAARRPRCRRSSRRGSCPAATTTISRSGSPPPPRAIRCSSRSSRPSSPSAPRRDARHAADDDPQHPRRAARRARAGRARRSCSTPPSSARSSGAACSSGSTRGASGSASSLGALEERGLIRREARLADPGRPAVLVQARPDAPGRVRDGAARAAPRAARGGRALPRGGDDRDGRVGGDARVPLARGRRRRARGAVLRRRPPITRAAAGRRSARSRSTTRRSSSCRRATSAAASSARKRAVAFQALYHVPDAARLGARRADQ